MRTVETIVVPIGCPFAKAYGLLSDPRNYPKWSPIPDPLFEPVGESGLDWLVELPRGRRVMRFSRPNDHGVLDYSILSEAGELEFTAYLRLLPNDQGCTLAAHYLQRPGLSDEAFRSEVEWVRSDLRALAVVLESI